MSIKGILLAGGNGTRLYPLTKSLSKHLLPGFDKPMIYYSLSILMLAGIREILIITRPEDIDSYKNLLGHGDEWGIKIEYIAQPKPEGLPQEFIGNSNVCLMLGDNIFYGNGLHELLQTAAMRKDKSTIFAYKVQDPERFGVVSFDKDRNVLDIEEKPHKPKSHYAVTGLYFYDNQVSEIAKSLKPSQRNELEISDLNREYLNQKKLKVEILGRGFSWLDAGTHTSLLEASHFVQTIENRQGLKIACLEEIALNNGWLSESGLEKIIASLPKNEYRLYLSQILDDFTLTYVCFLTQHDNKYVFSI